MLLLSVIAFSLGLESYVGATPIVRANSQNVVLYDGRVSSNFSAANLDDANSPYLAAVKGSQSADHYFQFLGNAVPPTPLWGSAAQDQAFLVSIDNTSIFVPGSGQPQNGFRRGELIAQQSKTGDRTAFDAQIESGRTAFHFSVMADPTQPLNVSHEYQAVFIEPNDGTHVFQLDMGTPFNTTLSGAAANMLRIDSHNGSVLFQTPFDQTVWHNFAVLVDWDSLTLQVFYSQNGCQLQAVSGVEDNSSATKGPNGQGDLHIGMVKLPLIDPTESPTQQADVAHFGIQEGSTDGLIYSGIFIEDAQTGSISLGGDGQ